MDDNQKPWNSSGILSGIATILVALLILGVMIFVVRNLK